MEDKLRPIINVAGDYVEKKEVQYEISNVEAGGIGIQIINGEKTITSSQPAPQPESTAQPSYTRHIDTTASTTAIGKLLVTDANSAKTKAEFINKISEIVQRTQLFTFKPNTSNQEKADFTNAILAAYGYKGMKCANITDDDFQRYF
jgi:hypothetical protein